MTSQISVEVVHDPSDRSVHTTSGVERFVGRNRSPRRLPMGEPPRLIYWNEALQYLGLPWKCNGIVAANDGKPLPLYQKALCGVTTRAIGATVGSPANSSLIHEWVLALWQGIGLTAVRAMALNMEMLASYDQSVEFFQDFLGLGEASIAMGPSVVSGKMQPNASGKYLYTSSLDYAMKTLKSGGPLKLYTGFPVHCVGIAPYVMCGQLTAGGGLPALATF
ncbi:Mitochondrial dicarboxylate/tricarboxylate transporter DTC [Vitis vinifera]|uniref:Mitochondrial dicarboxylate/tricarboxylate transporter DTC n=1 Tax=Vitis vinifera TaxID=29760 RepID=A0A438FXS7_VITVI|nr:Mitochondrial dicarboxylate/tricarboxylate transporter DTC [Vitis vinifera]